MIIGVIVEDQSDFEVLYALTAKIIPQNAFRMKKILARGSSQMRRKCGAWADNLVRRGCECVVVVHDLDEHDEDALRDSVDLALECCTGLIYLIVIPRREIEAWLLSDANALKTVFNMRRLPKVPNNPERVRDPKSVIRQLVWSSAKRRYLHTIHNGSIANAIRIKELGKCPSFLPYPAFVRKHSA